MNSEPYDPDYPVEIDLDRKVAMPTGISDGSKKSKSKSIGASLYISGGTDLSKIPKHGYALIEFDRRNISLSKRTGMEGHEKEESSVELEIHSLCLPDEETGDLADEFKKFAQSKGAETGGEPESDDDENEEQDDGEES